MKRNGLSLLEIIIAAGILVAAMVPLWGLMGSSHKQVTVSADEVRASQIAAEIFEQIENSNWFPDPGEVNFTLVKNGTIKIGTTLKLDLSVGDFPDYLEPKARLEIEKYPAAGFGRILRLSIDYRPKDKVGLEVKTYQIATFIAKK